MNKFIYCAIPIMVFGSCLRAELNEAGSSVPEATGTYKISDDENELQDGYKNLLLEFAEKHFQKYKVSVVLSNTGCWICDRILGVLMDASVQSFLTINDIATSDYLLVGNDTGMVSHKSIVVLAEKIDEFYRYFDVLRSMYFYNPRAQHLIFTVEKPKDEELEGIFKECWSHRVLNVAVMTCNREEAYTYNPYVRDESGMREKVEDWSKLFYDKLRNMNGHRIRTRYLPFSGIDKAKWIREESRFKFLGTDFGYAQAFFQTVNATPDYENLTVEMVPCYRSFSFRYKLWEERRFNGIELWMNFMPLQLVFRERSERAYPLRRDSLKVLAPKSGIKTPNIFEPYSNDTWTSVVMSFVAFVLYSYLLYQRRGVRDNAFFRTLGIFLGKNLAKRELGLLEKFTFIVFTMASLVILSVYQGALYGALATVPHYPEINTMSQLGERTKIISVAPVIAEFFRAFVQPGITVAEFDTGIDYTEHMKHNRNVAYAFPNSIAMYTSKLRYLSENGVPLYHVMNEYSVPGFVSHTLPYGSPYLEKLETVFLACKEAGLNQYWDAELKLHSILTGVLISDVAETRTLKKLSLESQLYGFYIWGMGLLVSCFCFVAEIYIHKYREQISTGH